MAIEFKSSRRLRHTDLKGLRALAEDTSVRPLSYPAKVERDVQRMESTSCRGRCSENGCGAAISSSPGISVLCLLGIAYYLKGEIRQAAYNFRQALAARPDDEGISKNLDQTLWALGRADESGGVAAATEVTDGDGSVRGDAARVDGDSFYWIEREDGG